MNKKAWTRLSAIFLCVMMVVTCLPAAAFAADGGVTSYASEGAQPEKPAAPTGQPEAGTYTMAQPKLSGTSSNGPMSDEEVNSYFRIPALVTLPNGWIVAASDARWPNTNDSPNNLDTIVSVSKDGGETWEWEIINYFADFAPLQGPTYYGTGMWASKSNSASFIDPALVVDGTGKLWMAVDLQPPNVNLNTNAQKAGSGFDESGWLIVGNIPESSYAGIVNTASTGLTESAAKTLIATHYLYRVDLNSEPTVTVEKDGETVGLRPIFHRDGKEYETGYYVDAFFDLWYDYEAGGLTPVLCQQKESTDYVQSNLFYIQSDMKAYSTTYLMLRSAEVVGDELVWSDPVLINHGIKGDDERFVVFCPGRGATIPLANGGERIMFQTYDNSTDTQRSSTVYSDDGGKTWSRGGRTASGASASESQIVTLPNGDLRLYSRNTGTYITYADSTDGGESWGETQVDSNLAYCGGCMVSFINLDGYLVSPDNEVYENLILASYPKENYRSSGVIRIGSVDAETNAVTWLSNDAIRYTGRYNYSCLTQLLDGKGNPADSFAVLFEQDDTSNAKGVMAMRFYKLTAEDLLGQGWYLVNEVPQPVTLSVDTSRVDIVAGENKAISFEYTPAEAEVRWTSSNESVATVEGGVVTGVSAGKTMVTVSVTMGPLTRTASVDVLVKSADGSSAAPESGPTIDPNTELYQVVVMCQVDGAHYWSYPKKNNWGTTTAQFTVGTPRENDLDNDTAEQYPYICPVTPAYTLAECLANVNGETSGHRLVTTEATIPVAYYYWNEADGWVLLREKQPDPNVTFNQNNTIHEGTLTVYVTCAAEPGTDPVEPGPGEGDREWLTDMNILGYDLFTKDPSALPGTANGQYLVLAQSGVEGDTGVYALYLNPASSVPGNAVFETEAVTAARLAMEDGELVGYLARNDQKVTLAQLLITISATEGGYTFSNGNNGLNLNSIMVDSGGSAISVTSRAGVTGAYKVANGARVLTLYVRDQNNTTANWYTNFWGPNADQGAMTASGSSYIYFLHTHVDDGKAVAVFDSAGNAIAEVDGCFTIPTGGYIQVDDTVTFTVPPCVKSVYLPKNYASSLVMDNNGGFGVMGCVITMEDDTTTSSISRSGSAGSGVVFARTGDNRLYFGGEGTMTDYSSRNTDAPVWLDGVGDRTLKSAYIGEGVANVGSNAFKFTALSSVTLSTGLEIIGDCAFESCRIDTIKIPDTVTDIGVNAFKGCLELRSVQLPESVTSIGSNAFANCTRLRDVTVTGSLGFLPSGAFQGISGYSRLNLVFLADAPAAAYSDFEGMLPFLHQNGAIVYTQDAPGASLVASGGSDAYFAVLDGASLSGIDLIPGVLPELAAKDGKDFTGWQVGDTDAALPAGSAVSGQPAGTVFTARWTKESEPPAGGGTSGGGTSGGGTSGGGTSGGGTSGGGTTGGGTTGGGSGGGTTPPQGGTGESDASVNALPFVDVAKDAWYAASVAYVYEQGLMKGTSDTTFLPGAFLNRGMMAQIIYNMAKNPETTARSLFTDVDGRYYTEAVAWGTANGVLQGYSESTFGGEDDLTREQMAVMLYRYGAAQGVDQAADAAALDSFADGAQVSGWAKDAVAWAVANGLLKGRGDNSLDPGATITRSEAATVLERYCKQFLS